MEKKTGSGKISNTETPTVSSFTTGREHPAIESVPLVPDPSGFRELVQAGSFARHVDMDAFTHPSVL
uniref:Uncharacterized protein n=1 Tax=Oryza glumipatula TaxID=40148 RepID=A0A0D9YF92_9ORYZ